MFSTGDTIVAIATPPGRGGLGVVRLSGSDAVRIAHSLIERSTPLTPRYATFARLSRTDTGPGDEVVITWFPAPRSYTGDDVVELSAHGSPVVLTGIVEHAIRHGARLAEPGEFTLRAFLHGKRDLVQAEAVADLIDAVTPLQARTAYDQLEGTLTATIATIESSLFDLAARLEASLDFPEEGFHFIEPQEVCGAIDAVLLQIDRLLADAARGRLVREGAVVAIVGAPNVGKSSLFNALLNTNRAIVTEVPGTTRDLLTERVELEGLLVELVDTAGLRETDDVVEREGVERAAGSVSVADVSVVVLDRSRVLHDEDRRALEATAGRSRVVVWNKADLTAATQPADDAVPADAVVVSVRDGNGLNDLTRRLLHVLSGNEVQRDTPRLTNLRHVHLLEQARGSLEKARAAVAGGVSEALPEEFVLVDLQDAQGFLQEVTGKRTTDDLLRHVFERFCVGK